MPIDPNDILAVAILLSKQNTEATDRSAVMAFLPIFSRNNPHAPTPYPTNPYRPQLL